MKALAKILRIGKRLQRQRPVSMDNIDAVSSDIDALMEAFKQYYGENLDRQLHPPGGAANLFYPFDQYTSQHYSN